MYELFQHKSIQNKPTFEVNTFIGVPMEIGNSCENSFNGEVPGNGDEFFRSIGWIIRIIYPSHSPAYFKFKSLNTGAIHHTPDSFQTFPGRPPPASLTPYLTLFGNIS